VADGGRHADPWIVLGLIAARTKRVLLGTCVTPLARRRPAKLAREILTLNDLSSGRFIFGAGSGAAQSEFDDLGEEVALRTRADMLDEGLELLRALWSGERVNHRGTHYRAVAESFAPAGADIPIWLAGTWPNRRPFRRAARYDGVFAVKAGFVEPLTAAEVGEIAGYVRRHREDAAPFNLAVGANTTGDAARDAERVGVLEAAGANWWLDGTSTRWESLEALERRVRAGPPAA
jgi:alkanesulfonate monooxygenase SsuD/methylene tetrahydromethanopterin reductase-like flavin-dependent oxidoreductase (luciferase family)